MTAGSRPVDLKRAMIDPASLFRSPDEVIGNEKLSRENKIEILYSWAYDTAELAVAEEEGMGGGESADMSAVLRALDRITRIEPHSSAPTKQGGFCIGQPHRLT
ncbi:MAG TPA: hypothetical protein VN750_15990 [Steroidobacteraceae bacterium]|nr:hypothetical protein [Steroidobacteraceae bacterium]